MRFVYLLIVVAMGALATGSVRADQDRFTFDFPLKCALGSSCWIVNYVDMLPGQGVMDYMCGDATYDAPPKKQHKGTDIAIRDMAGMRLGVPVYAAAAGRVLGQRDGVQDVGVNAPVQGRECGNAVRIQHDNALVTQYCHMRKGSVLVSVGDRVARGQTLGMVGLSGLTNFPHLHFQVERATALIDPFAGLDRQKACGAGEKSLWDDTTLARFPYRPTAIYNAGFAAQKPDLKALRDGVYTDRAIPPRAPALVMWAEFFRVRGGDQIKFTIKGPGGGNVHTQTVAIKTDKVRYFAYSGRRAKSPWPVGTYSGEVTLIRGAKTFTARRLMKVR